MEERRQVLCSLCDSFSSVIVSAHLLITVGEKILIKRCTNELKHLAVYTKKASAVQPSPCFKPSEVRAKALHTYILGCTAPVRKLA